MTTKGTTTKKEEITDPLEKANEGEVSSTTATAEKESDNHATSVDNTSETEDSTTPPYNENDTVQDKESKEEERLRGIGLTLLENYPDQQEIYMTTNGFGFFELNEANSFAATLKNKTVQTVVKK